MVEKWHTEYRNLLFGVQRSVRYHNRRRGFYERCHTLIVFFGVVGGSATIGAFGAAVTEDLPLWVKLLPAFLTTLLSAWDLVVGNSRKAWQHADLARQFINLEQRLVADRAAPSDELDKIVTDITVQRLVIESTEPPILQVLNILCDNELRRAMGYPRKEDAPVSFFQRMCASFFDFRERTIDFPERTIHTSD